MSSEPLDWNNPGKRMMQLAQRRRMVALPDLAPKEPSKEPEPSFGAELVESAKEALVIAKTPKKAKRRGKIQRSN